MIKHVVSVGILLLAFGAPRCVAPAQENALSTNGRPAAQNEQPVTSGQPKSAEDFYKRGVIRSEAKQYREAINDFKRSIRLKPDEIRAHYDLGLAYFSLNLYEEAAGAYKQAVRLKPDWAEARFRLGWMYSIAGKRQLAQEQYRALQKLEGGYAEMLGRILQEPQAASAGNTVPEAKDRAVAGAGIRTGDEPGEVKPPDPIQPSDGADAAPKGSNSLTEPAGGQPAKDVATAEATPKTESPSKKGNAAAQSDPLPTTEPAAPKTEPPSKTTENTAPKGAPTPKAEPGVAKTESTSKTDNIAPRSDPAPKVELTAANHDPAPATEILKKASEDPPTSIYRVGVGDVLDIRLLNTSTNRSTLFTVMEGGVIEYPLAGGSIPVSGLTTAEIGSRLATEIKRRKVQDNPSLIVSVREYVSHSVILSGLLSNPGSKILRREAVPLYALLAEAQPRTDVGRAVIMRSSGQVAVDLTDPSAINVLVYPGDVVTVLARLPQFYYIGGHVYTPGQKAFQPGITLMQAILAAGGLSRTSANIVSISREGEDGRLTTNKFALREIRSGKAPDPRLNAGDRIEVGP